MAKSPQKQTLPETRVVFTVGQLCAIISTIVGIVGGIITLVIYAHNQILRLDKIEQRMAISDSIMLREVQIRKIEMLYRYPDSPYYYYYYDDSTRPVYDPIRDTLILKNYRRPYPYFMK
jgi:hypothetical protein